jgi:hypothetical protein
LFYELSEQGGGIFTRECGLAATMAPSLPYLYKIVVVASVMIIKKDDYQKYADCIRMEQMSAPEISELFEDEKFHNWYRRKYRNPYFRKNLKNNLEEE